jgi:hypothetical protein
VTAVRSSPTAERPRTTGRSRRSFGDRFTAGHVVPVVLAVMATVVILVALRDRSSVVMVPVAAKTIVAGAPVDGSAVTYQRLAASSALRSGIVSAASLSGGGWVATTSIQRGDPITTSEVQRSAPATSGLGSMSLTVPADDADGGNLVTGDQVDVIEAVSGQADYVARGLQVLSVAPTATRTGSLTASGPGSYYIVVAVNPSTALALTAALQNGSQGVVEVVRTTGMLDDTDASPVTLPLTPATQTPANGPSVTHTQARR